MTLQQQFVILILKQVILSIFKKLLQILLYYLVTATSKPFIKVFTATTTKTNFNF